MPNVKIIPATKDIRTGISIERPVKRKVAGYARVSTDSDEQFTSYEAQVDYYTEYIKRNPEWEFVKVYTDEGISGTNTKHRTGFNEMIADALDGKIDLIVTKSVSRFARNTVDSLSTIRQLKDKGVECYFEKENIYTFDGKGELMITIMSSLAQEESRSISENVTWGARKRFSDGRYSMPYKQFLGYRKGPDGKPEIVPEEAEIVRTIYDMFMSGMTPGGIAKELTARSIPTPANKPEWHTSTVLSILKNEKYKGDALLQKHFTVDFLQKKKKVNEGEVTQYYCEASHPAIITPALFDKVQKELERRKGLGRNYSGKSIFSCRIICGECGSFYGRKVWSSNTKYVKPVFVCNGKYKGDDVCSAPHLYESDIKIGFIMAFNKLVPNRDRYIEDCRIMQATLTDISGIDKKINELNTEIEVLTELTCKLIAENQSEVIDQEEYLARYNDLVDRYDTAMDKIARLENTREKRSSKADIISGFMFDLMERSEPLAEFDDRLWLDAIEHVTVFDDGRMVYKFWNDSEITINIQDLHK